MRSRPCQSGKASHWTGLERSDPIIATSIKATGLLVACVLPPILVGFLLLNGREVDHRLPESGTLLTEYLEQDAESKNLVHQNVEIPRLPAPR